jgi:hypothetical protein
MSYTCSLEDEIFSYRYVYLDESLKNEITDDCQANEKETTNENLINDPELIEINKQPKEEAVPSSLETNEV